MRAFALCLWPDSWFENWASTGKRVEIRLKEILKQYPPGTDPDADEQKTGSSAAPEAASGDSYEEIPPP